MDPRHAVLFEPVRIGPKVLRNRFYQVPHASGFGTRLPRTHAAFRAIKAEGGWAAVCTDYASISDEADETPAVSTDVWDRADAAALGLLVEQVHAHGALAGIELFHGGRDSTNGVSRRPLLAPSPIAGERVPYSVPKQMDSYDIERVQRQWVDAALAARDVGAVGVGIVPVGDGKMRHRSPHVTAARTAKRGSRQAPLSRISSSAAAARQTSA